MSALFVGLVLLVLGFLMWVQSPADGDRWPSDDDFGKWNGFFFGVTLSGIIGLIAGMVALR